MGRPIKIGLSYFPLDVNFFNNAKIKTLRRKHGAIGVLTYLNILCKVYEKDGYFYKIPDGDKESFYVGIAEEIASGNDQIRHVTSRVQESIHHLIEQDMLDRDLFEKDVITGKALQEQYVLSSLRANRKIQMDAYLLVDVLEIASQNRISYEETGISYEETGVSYEESAQIKEYKRKIKERTYIPPFPPSSEENEPKKGDGNDTTPYRAIMDLFVSICKDLPKPISIKGSREAHVRARYVEHPDLSFFEEYFKKVAASDFLCGRSSSWKASFDWLFLPTNMPKVLEGNYDNKPSRSAPRQQKEDQPITWTPRNDHEREWLKDPFPPRSEADAEFRRMMEQREEEGS